MRGELDDMRRQLAASFKHEQERIASLFKYEQERNAITRARMQQHIDKLQEQLAAEKTNSQLLAQALDEADECDQQFLENGDIHQDRTAIHDRADNSEQATDDGDATGFFDAQNTFYHSAVNAKSHTNGMSMHWGSVDTRSER
jgi:ribosomal protein L18